MKRRSFLSRFAAGTAAFAAGLTPRLFAASTSAPAAAAADDLPPELSALSPQAKLLSLLELDVALAYEQTGADFRFQLGTNMAGLLDHLGRPFPEYKPDEYANGFFHTQVASVEVLADPDYPSRYWLFAEERVTRVHRPEYGMSYLTPEQDEAFQLGRAVLGHVEHLPGRILIATQQGSWLFDGRAHPPGPVEWDTVESENLDDAPHLKKLRGPMPFHD